MNRTVKKWCIAAAILMAVGALLAVGALPMIGFDMTKLSTRKMETNTYRLHQDFQRIAVNAETAGVTFALSDSGECRVECVEEENLTHTVSLQDGTLTISAVDDRKWYDHIGINFWSPKVTVYLPKDAYTALSVATKTGHVEIPADFAFETVSVAGTTSKIVCAAQVSKRVELRTTTGSITLGPVQAETVTLSATTGRITAEEVRCGTLAAKSTTGRIRLENVIAQESMKLENTTGGVQLEGCDAAEITVKTTTGSVKGTLRSEKVFVTGTSTGSVRVPATAQGGRCEITTTTGNISIEIRKTAP